jgi:hypothetical protein
MPNSGHFPMLDEPEKYLGLVRGFLQDAPPPANGQPGLAAAGSLPETPPAPGQ